MHSPSPPSILYLSWLQDQYHRENVDIAKVPLPAWDSVLVHLYRRLCVLTLRKTLARISLWMPLISYQSVLILWLLLTSSHCPSEVHVSLPYILNPKYHTSSPDWVFVYLWNFVARPTLPVFLSAFFSSRLPQGRLRLWELRGFSRFQTLLWSSPKQDDQTHHSNNPTSGTNFCFNSVSSTVINSMTQRNLGEEKVNFIFHFWVRVHRWSQSRNLRQEPGAEAVGWCCTLTHFLTSAHLVFYSPGPPV